MGGSGSAFHAHERKEYAMLGREFVVVDGDGEAHGPYDREHDAIMAMRSRAHATGEAQVKVRSRDEGGKWATVRWLARPLPGEPMPWWALPSPTPEQRLAWVYRADSASRR